MKLALARRSEPSAHAPALAFASDDVTRDALIAAFATRGWPANAIAPGGIAGALQLRRQTAVNLLVVDIDGSVDPAADVAALAATGTARRILAIGSVNDVALYRALTVAGAGDYLVKPFAAALANALEAPDTGSGEARRCPIVVVTGARGGVGASTIAANLAWVLAEERHRRVALLDLDLHLGSVALAFDMESGRGLREALERPSRIDSLFVERALEKRGQRLAILAAEEPLQDHPLVDPAAPDVLLHELQGRFDAIVIDLPRNPGLMQQQFLASASHICVVAEHSLAGMRDTMRLHVLARDCAPTAKVVIIAGGLDRADPKVTRSDLERGLGRKIDAVVPWDRKAVMGAAGSGKPLGEVAPSSKVLVVLRGLADGIAGAPAARATNLFKRVLRGG